MTVIQFPATKTATETCFVCGKEFPEGTCSDYPVMGGKVTVQVHPGCDLKLSPAR